MYTYIYICNFFFLFLNRHSSVTLDRKCIKIMVGVMEKKKKLMLAGIKWFPKLSFVHHKKNEKKSRCRSQRPLLCTKSVVVRASNVRSVRDSSIRK